MKILMLVIIIVLLTSNLTLLRTMNDYPELKLNQYKQSLLHSFISGCNRALNLSIDNPETRRYTCDGMASEYEKELNEVFE